MPRPSDINRGAGNNVESAGQCNEGEARPALNHVDFDSGACDAEGIDGHRGLTPTTGVALCLAPPDPFAWQGGLLQQLATIELKLDDVSRKVDTLAGNREPFIESRLPHPAVQRVHSGGREELTTQSDSKPARPFDFAQGANTREHAPVEGAAQSDELVRRDRRLPTNDSKTSKKDKALQVLADKVMAYTAPELKGAMTAMCTTNSMRSKASEACQPEETSPGRRTSSRLQSIITTTARSEAQPGSKIGLFMSMVNKTQKLLLLDSFMGFVIIVNIVLLGVSADVDPDWIGWYICDCIFLALFSGEFLIRLKLQGWRNYIRGPERRWHFIEVMCLSFAVVEVVLGSFASGAAQENLGSSHALEAIAAAQEHRRLQDHSGASLTTLRTVRVLRIARILRVARFAFFAELVVMINGTIGGFRTLGWACVLMCLPLYAIALLFRESLGDDNQSFSGVPISFFTVFECILGADCLDENGKPLFHHIAVHSGWGFAAIYLVATILIAVGLMNVIIAIFVENVVAAARTNEAFVKRQRSRDKVFFANKMTQLVELISALQEGRSPEVNSKRLLRSATARGELFAKAAEIEITPELFEELRQCPVWNDICHDLEVAAEDHFNLFDTLDVDGSGTIDIEELIEGISKLRGDARRSDIIGVSFMVHKLAADTHEALEKITVMLKQSAADSRAGSPSSPSRRQK